jgi:YD repeat-containing protein
MTKKEWSNAARHDAATANIKRTPEEKAMKTSYHLSEFGSFKRARQIVGGVILLLALTLAGPPRLWGECQQAVTGLSFDMGSIIALTEPSTGTATGTVTLNCNWAGSPGVDLSNNSGGVLETGGGATCSLGKPTCTFPASAYQVASATSYTVTATLHDTNSSASGSLTVVPLEATVMVSPSGIVGGSGQQAKVTVTTNGPVISVSPYAGQTYSDLPGNCTVSGNVDAAIGPGNKSVTVNMGASTVTQDTLCTFILGNLVWGGPTTSGSIMVTPPNGAPGNPSEAGPAKCENGVNTCGLPINITNGNVWIKERDFSVPGLGGGLDLTRTWNSLRFLAGPPSLAGMFGLGWQSTYEEQMLAVNGQTVQYWRGDGSGWTFAYNGALNSYSLSSPPDERAQLVQNPATGGFTLTLPDGTQKAFNSQGLLAALIDRNHNQTTLAYDSSNRLTSVTSAGGSTLTFNYGDPNNPMQVTTAQDSVGVVATYVYDSYSRLTSVTYPDSSAFNFAYDPNNPPMIKTVNDSKGNLLESHTYDTQFRGLTSTRANLADSVTLTY